MACPKGKLKHPGQSKTVPEPFIPRRGLNRLHVMRSIVGWSAAGLGLACAFALILGMLNVIPDMQSTILHQSGFRWLAEGAIGGLLIAAIAFWRFQ